MEYMVDWLTVSIRLQMSSKTAGQVSLRTLLVWNRRTRGGIDAARESYESKEPSSAACSSNCSAAKASAENVHKRLL